MSLTTTSREIGKVILITLAVSGVVVLAATSPGFGYLLREVEKRRFKKYKASRINFAFKRLQQQELINIEEDGDDIRVELSDKGRKKVLSYKVEEMKLKKGKWDGWWRIVIFDIPEHKRNARDFLRAKMKELGFYMLQKSVLVTPWPCRDEIDFIKYFYEVGECVNLIQAKSFDGEEQVRRYFNL